jgi:lipopolysaccharide/colanic/teichoic acid biosynthesis glycosyltransferase
MSPASPTTAESSRAPAATAAAGVPAGAFQLTLHHEQERIDRHGRGQILLVLRPGAEPLPSGWVPPALRAAAARWRQSDQVGVLREDAVGVLLPFTGAEAAVRLGGELCARLAQDGLALASEVQVLAPRVEAQRARRRAERASTGTLAGESVDVRWEPRGIQAVLARPLPRWKRVLDVGLAALGLLLLAPLMALIALLILVTSGRPILYAHERTGLGLTRFRMLKFRTMRVSHADGWADVQYLNEMNGLVFKSAADPRVLRLGKLLRRTSLDELPQLVNVLRGDMTLIGPRALSPTPEKYEPWQLRRFDVTPGIACTWQAERRADTDTAAWMRSDIAYVARGDSPRGDLAILRRVLWSVLLCRGGR